MQNPRITQKHCEALKSSAGGRATLTDSEVPGLTLRATPRAKSWSYLTRIDGEKRRFSIGAYGSRGPAFGEYSLAEAREEARRLRELARQGRDPVREAKAAKKREEAEKAARQTVDEAIATYARLYLEPNLRTAAERERQLRAALAPHADRPIADLTRLDIQRAVDQKAAEGRLGAANRIRAALLHFSRWCWQRGYLAEHVASGVPRAGTERPRDRVLTIDEVRAISDATADLAPLWQPFARILILTAQRRGDVAGMRWCEIDLEARRWTLPAERTKSRRRHVVHLSEPVMAELRALREDAAADLVFSTTGETPISGFSKLKTRLDRASGVKDWRLHDLRTAFASILCEMGQPEGVVDRVLNHAAVGSAASAVARVYNQSELLPQRARALDRWAEIVTGERGVVVALPGARHAEP